MIRKLTEAEVATWYCVIGAIHKQRIAAEPKPIEQMRAIRPITGIYPRFGWVERQRGS